MVCLSDGAWHLVGLLGPNGSGKTSSIRMMIGMTVPDSGSLFGQLFNRSQRYTGTIRPIPSIASSASGRSPLLG